MICGPYQDFPYGLQQTLSIGSLSLPLTVSDRNYIEGGQIRFGYRRYIDPAQQIGVTYSNWGVSVKDGPAHLPKMMFEWDLRLSVSQLYMLEAIWEEQQISGNAIRLRDQRLAARQKSPRTRAKIGNLITTPAPPSGHVFFWGQFDVLLQLDSNFFTFSHKKGTDNRYEVTLKALEMDNVPTSEDA